MRGERVRYELEQLDEPTQPVDNYNCLGIWFSPSKTNRLNSFALDGVYRASVRTGRAGAVFRIRQQKAPWQGKNEAIFFTPMTSPAGTVWKPEHLYDWTLLAPTPVPPSKRRCDWSPRVKPVLIRPERSPPHAFGRTSLETSRDRTTRFLLGHPMDFWFGPQLENHIMSGHSTNEYK